MSSMVWIVRDTPGDDFIKRELLDHFGRVSTVFGSEINPYHLVDQLGIIQRDVLPVASADDYIVLAGPRVMVATLMLEWGRHFDKVQLLLYDQRKRNYTSRVLMLSSRYDQKKISTASFDRRA